MPLSIDDLLATEKNKLYNKNPWLSLISIEAFSHSNLLTRSEDFSHASWVKTQATVSANQAEAPDSNTTGDKVTTTGAAAEIMQEYTIADPENRTFTFSVFVKPGTAGPDTAGFSFKLRRGDNSDETIVAGTAITWIPCYGGWFRGSIKKTFSSSTTGDNVRAIIALAVNAKNFYLWGAHLEETSDLLFYIPTIASPVTTTYHHMVNFHRYITWDGFCYTPFPVSIGPIKASTSGELPTVPIAISNAGRLLTKYMRDYKGMIGKDVDISLVHSSLLSDPTDAVVPESLVVSSSAMEDPVITLNAGSGGDLYGVEGPIGDYNKDNCPSLPYVTTPRVSLGVI
jgi:hypothetical protein